MEVGGTNTQMETKILILLSILFLWNLGKLCPQNLVTFLGNCMHVDRSLELPNPKKKGKTHSSSLIGPIGISNMTLALDPLEV
jgi:hypothetical protein